MPQIEILNFEDYVEKLHELPLENEAIMQVKAFYNHTVQAFCTDPRALLIPLDDHLVHRGDGVFESLTCRDRKIINLDKHLERLASSLSAIKLDPPVSLLELREIIILTARVGDFENGNIRVLIGRGRGGFGINPRECKEASIYIIASEQESRNDAFWNKGIKAVRSNIPVKQKYLAKIKSTNYLPNVLMSMEANEQEADIAISFDDKGYVAESSICNLAIFKKDTFYFPTFDSILAGTTVLQAIEKAREIAKVEIVNITEEMLREADEVLAIGSTIACVGIVEYNQKKINKGIVGENTLKLKDLLLEDYFANSVEY